MGDFYAACSEVHRTAGVRTDNDIGSGTSDGCELTVLDECRHFGLEDRVRSARTAAQALVVEFYQFPDVGRQDRSGCQVGSLHVAKVARILDRYS